VNLSGFGVKIVRIRNLPTEVSNEDLKDVLALYGSNIMVDFERYAKNSLLYPLLTGVQSH
jgi:RNA recognition motif-containing protein